MSIKSTSTRDKDARVVGPTGSHVRELIPPNVGSGPHRKNVQAVTLAVWITTACLSTALFYQPWVGVGSNYRAAALGLVFPGAGYLASANPLGYILFVLTLAAIPPALFAWFGAGAIVFLILVWGLSILGAYAVTSDTVWESAGLYTFGGLVAIFAYANRSASAERIRGLKTREARNVIIPQQLARMDEAAARESKPEEDEELDLEALRKIQFLFDQAFQDLDDWSGFTVIDQFQTSALRYQIYQMMYILGLYQAVYAPNVHGYVSEAFRRVIERSLTKKVLEFWKWERLAGKFSLDWDPVQHDNIMVTGFLLHGVMLYTANTGDYRYTQPGSLNFHVTDNRCYKYSVHDLQESLVRQWSSSPYFLIPCEPNWIYVMCNLQGMTGAVLYDRVFGTKATQMLLPSFEESLNTNFTETSGSVLTIRSELTGFAIPGIAGVAGDLAVVMMGSGPLRNLSRRLWAVVREENVVFDEETKELSMTGLVGADNIDTGNYTSSANAVFSQVAIGAAEYGEEALKSAAIEKLEKEWGLLTTSTGSKSFDLTKCSTLMNYAVLTATLLRPGAYNRMVQKGPSETALSGPILSEVPYPGVLVAKARSHTSKDLELVLYPSADDGVFKLGISRLEPGAQYKCQGKVVKADEEGNLSFSATVSGRTRLHIRSM
ncbi:Ldi domain-containing protein [Fusarium sp. LHS14.1]|nr:Ldi domain-containing protein [Fusarium sp. LHS14.1]